MERMLRRGLRRRTNQPPDRDRREDSFSLHRSVTQALSPSLFCAATTARCCARIEISMDRDQRWLSSLPDHSFDVILRTWSLSPFAQIVIVTGGNVAMVGREEVMPVKTKPNLDQLMNWRRPLLFSLMPRMLRGDGTMAGVLRHRFRYFEGIHPHAPVSAHRWRSALQTSRILAGQRRRANRAR